MRRWLDLSPDGRVARACVTASSAAPSLLALGRKLFAIFRSIRVTAALATVLSLLTAFALADEAPPPEPPVKATLFLMPHPTVPDETMVAVQRAFDAALRENHHLEVFDLEARLADFAQEVPQEQLEAARKALAEGRTALLHLKLPEAVAQLDQAVTGLAKVLPYIKKQELADAMAALAVAKYESGNERSGRAEFVRLLTWRSDYEYDPQRLSPNWIGPFEEVRRELQRTKRGGLAISSEPVGAQAYVDGKYLGLTPCTTEELAPGEHFVTLKKEGFKKTVTPAQVRSGRQQRVPITLERNEKYLLIGQALGKLQTTLGADRGPAEMDDLRQALFVEHAVFVKAQGSAGRLELDAYLYDLRTRRRLARVTKQLPAVRGESEVASLVASLYLNVNYQPELEAPKDAPPPPPLMARPAVYKTWWFWTAAVAVVGAAVGTGVAVYETRPATCPAGSGCFRVVE